jgi:hypothetical protein
VLSVVVESVGLKVNITPGYEDTCLAVASISGEEESPIRMWPVDQDEIAQAEERLGRELPEPLKEVWSAIGTGFFQGSLRGDKRMSRINALMSPDEVADAIEADDNAGEATPFFDISDGGHLVLTAGGIVEHPLFPGNVISPSLKAFIAAVADTPDFWLQKLPSPRP